ncbi:hypothetical protein [Paenarthrobacter histidinolovorans]|uniref:Uncharacterized protein n=1 Tax=Paenarthrobacter histidinolovorans TaxID=43664 RepID=A0ABW8N2F9_9MICC
MLGDRTALADLLIRSRGKATHRQVAAVAKIGPIRLKELEAPSKSIDKLVVGCQRFLQAKEVVPGHNVHVPQDGLIVRASAVVPAAEGNQLIAYVETPQPQETHNGFKHLTERHGSWATKWNPGAELASVVLKTQFVSGETLEVLGTRKGKTLSRFIGDPDSWVTLDFERADRPGVDATATPG